MPEPDQTMLHSDITPFFVPILIGCILKHRLIIFLTTTFLALLAIRLFKVIVRLQHFLIGILVRITIISIISFESQLQLLSLEYVLEHFQIVLLHDGRAHEVHM